MEWKCPPKDKILIFVFLSLFGCCFVASNLFVPQIFLAIVEHDHPEYTADQSQAKASRYKSYYDGVQQCVNLFGLPLFGTLSDAYGRRTIMAFGTVVQMLGFVTLYLAYAFKLLWLLYAMCAFAFVMIIQLCGIAYMGDIAKDEAEKTKNYGMSLAAFMFGMICGALILGVIGKSSIYNALYTLMGIVVLMLFIIVVFFKENSKFYQDRHLRKFSFKKGNPFQAVKLMLGKNAYVTCMVLIYAFIFIGMSDSMSTSVIYAQHRYGWQSLENGVSSAVRGLAGVLWQAIGLGLLLKRFSRQSILTWVLPLTAVTYIFLGLAPKGWMFLLGGVIAGFASITFPMIQALVSEQIPKDQQGMALGGMSSVSAIATLIGSLIGGNVFAWCLESKGFTCPGTIYYFSGLIYLLAGVFCFILFKKFPSGPKIETEKLKDDGKELLLATEQESEGEESSTTELPL
jgi:DHA1 family tetracycline resistance protein-like MFS transporter